jgi:hypothetical protein
VRDESEVFRQKMLGEDGSVRRGVVLVKQPGLFSPKLGATSSHVFTQSPQKIAVEPGIHSLACWDKLFVPPQPLHRWRYQSGIFWIQPSLPVRLILRRGRENCFETRLRITCYALLAFVTERKFGQISYKYAELLFNSFSLFHNSSSSSSLSTFVHISNMNSHL